MTAKGDELARVLDEMIRDRVRAELAEADLLDVDGAAKLLGRTPAAIRQAVHRGQLPCVRIGRVVRFSRAALLAMAQSQAIAKVQ